MDTLFSSQVESLAESEQHQVEVNYVEEIVEVVPPHAVQNYFIPLWKRWERVCGYVGSDLESVFYWESGWEFDLD